MVAVILLLSGLLVWASIGHLDTYAEANVIAKDKQLQIIVADQRAKMVKDGMTLNIEGEEVVIENVKLDEYGRALATGELDIKDGEYTGKVVVESIHPISFLLIYIYEEKSQRTGKKGRNCQGTCHHSDGSTGMWCDLFGNDSGLL